MSEGDEVSERKNSYSYSVSEGAEVSELGSFPECWRSANVTAIPKDAPSPDQENYRPITITPILSKVHEK